MTVAELFAAHTIGTQFSGLSPQARERAAIYILDSLRVGIAGSSVAGSEELLRVASGWGEPTATVWGRNARLSAPAAAFLNAWQMHNQEFDCLREGAVVHAMASVLPAAMAAAELHGGTSGAELIVAVAVGADIAAGLGLASRAGLRFFRPATAGGFGAVAAAGQILGLTCEQLQAAFAWQLAQASGTMQAHVEGSPILPVQVAFNARAAIHSCEMAQLDFPATRSVFEGPYGYMSLFEGEFALDPILADLGREWRVAQFSHKPFPAGRAAHAGIEGVMVLRGEHGFAANDVDRVEVMAPPLIVLWWGRKLVSNVTAAHARLCIGYVIAKVLRSGQLDLADFRDDALADPETHALAGRVECQSDGNPDPNALAPQTVVVYLKDGTMFRWDCATMLASPSRPITREAHLQKFHRCCSFAAQPLAPDAPARLVEAIDRLEHLKEVGLLLPLISRPRG